MQTFFKQRSLPFFIIGSLILLAILEALWLRRAYENERSELRVNAFQSLRGALSEENSFQFLNELRKNPAIDSLIRNKKSPSSIVFRESKINTHDFTPPSVDSLKIQSGVNIIVDARINDTNRRSPVVIRLADSNFVKKSQFKFRVLEKDALSGGMKTRDFGDDTANFRPFSLVEALFNDSVSHHVDADSVIIRRLKERLLQDFQRKNLHLPFDVSILEGRDAAPTLRSAIVATMPLRDGTHRRRAALAIYDTEGYLMRKIVPEILLGIFVLGVISFSFWLVYKNFKQQKQLTDLKNDLISNITHELKTPIATVSVALEALQNFDAGKNPQLTSEYLNISRQELNRLSMLVDKVLKLSIFEQKEPELNREILNLSALVNRVVDSMRLQFQKYNATITIEDHEMTTLNLVADPTHLTSVVYNLLDNALKYGGKQISIKMTPLSNFIQLEVRDNGKGISEEYQDKIFDKFFRVPAGDVHNTKGHGLGLSYVLSVVELHGGTISVDSTAGVGSTFSVTLPRNA